MSDSVYRVTEGIGGSSEFWEAAAANAVETAAKTVRDLRIAEVVRQDVAIEDGRIKSYRTRLAISFKYDGGDCALPGGGRPADPGGMRLSLTRGYSGRA